MGSLPSEMMSYLQTNFPLTYTAVGANLTGNGLVVYMTDETPSIQAQIVSKFSTLAQSVTAYSPPLSFVQSANSLKSEIATASQLESASVHQALETSGVNVVTVFPMPTGLVDVGVVGLTASGVNLLQSEFGIGTMNVHNVAPNDTPTANSSRSADTSPFSGGDGMIGNIGNNQAGLCSNGPAIWISGTAYPLTAAHCYEGGVALYNWTFSGSYMGTVHSRDVSNGGDDTALISGSSNGYVWTGVIGSATKVPIYNWATNPVGFTVYNEGAYSGEVSSVVQNNYYGCAWEGPPAGLTSNRQACNLVWTKSSGIATQDGDSGGPVIRYASGNLEIGGIVAAGSGSIGCQYNKPSYCYTNLYYTAMDEILATEYPGSDLRTP